MATSTTSDKILAAVRAKRNAGLDLIEAAGKYRVAIAKGQLEGIPVEAFLDDVPDDVKPKLHEYFEEDGTRKSTPGAPDGSPPEDPPTVPTPPATPTADGPETELTEIPSFDFEDDTLTPFRGGKVKYGKKSIEMKQNATTRVVMLKSPKGKCFKVGEDLLRRDSTRIYKKVCGGLLSTPMRNTGGS